MRRQAILAETETSHQRCAVLLWINVHYPLKKYLRFNLLHEVRILAESRADVRSYNLTFTSQQLMCTLFCSMTNKPRSFVAPSHSYLKYFVKRDLEIAKESPMAFTGYSSFPDCHSLEYEIQSRLHSSS